MLHRVPRRTGDAGLRETLPPELARVAAAARGAALGVVAAVSDRVIDAEARAELDDLRLGELDQRRVDAEPAAARGDLLDRLERADELGVAVGVAAGVEHV